MFDDAFEVRYISHRDFQPMAPANSLPSFACAGTLGQWANARLSWRMDNCFDCPPEKIAMAHERGLKVCLRAGDSVESVRHMLHLGLDYIPTNCMHLPLSRTGGIPI